MKQSVLLFTVIVLLSACGNGGHDHHATQGSAATADAQTRQMAISESFQTSFELALDAYFDLKDALVETNQAKAADLAGVLLSRLQVVDADGLNADAAALWSSHGAVATSSTQKIAGEPDVEQQRLFFEDVSKVFIDMVKAYGPFENTIYRQTCPMVRGGSADWLSREERVMNPYHGSRMLNCGSVVERI
jgi:uncharacterized protein YceK